MTRTATAGAAIQVAQKRGNQNDAAGELVPWRARELIFAAWPALKIPPYGLKAIPYEVRPAVTRAAALDETPQRRRQRPQRRRK